MVVLNDKLNAYTVNRGQIGRQELDESRRKLNDTMSRLRDEMVSDALAVYEAFEKKDTSTMNESLLKMELYNVTNRLNIACDACEGRNCDALTNLYAALENIGNKHQ